MPSSILTLRLTKSKNNIVGENSSFKQKMYYIIIVIGTNGKYDTHQIV